MSGPAPRRTDLADIKALLQGRVLELAQELAPDGYRSGSYWIARNPTRNDERPGSFWIRVQGSGLGVWADEATGDGAAQCPNGQLKGDIVDLVRYCARLGTVGDALKWSRDFLQLGQMPEADRQRRAAATRHHQKRSEVEQAEKLEQHRRRALALFIEAKKRPFLGSPADVYLRSRAIDVRQLGRMPGLIGWAPRVWHEESQTFWPCMVAGMVDGKGQVIAIHRTFLAEDGNGKAPIKPVRKMWPSYGGGAIWLWRGGSKLSIGEAAQCGLRETLVITEGIEKGLPVALASPELRVWATGSVGNMAKVTLPECCDDVLICADNDWGNPQAQGQLEAAVAAYVAQGRTVRIARSHVGKDVTDLIGG